MDFQDHFYRYMDSILLLTIIFCPILAKNFDSKGYMVYCPCMGRFGNQAEHFLGSLAKAKQIDRTLILPPWIEYDYAKPNSSQIPFDTYFSVEPIAEYHRVITMERFMAEIAPDLWPLSKRFSFCWSPRTGVKNDDCNAKDGNPFGPFWDHFDVNFVGSKFYGALNEDEWNLNFPPSEYPVLAFVGAPARFPMLEEHRVLHRYLKWSKMIGEKADTFIRQVLTDGKFLGVHLRNDLDWDNVCTYAEGSSQLFSSAQCLGYQNEHGMLTKDICQPSKRLILNQTKTMVELFDLKSVFIASDRHHMLNEFTEILESLGVKAYKLEKNDPHVDLAILGRSSYFIGNCVSSFSAFVKRERDTNDLPSGFWGIDVRPIVTHLEL